MAELSNFQKQILFGNRGETLFTQHEFDKALAEAKAEIITIAIEATKYAISEEREACAVMADECVDIEKLGAAIRARALVQKH
jgi:uncharacterized membrane protein